jgi:hypothetical protein
MFDKKFIFAFLLLFVGISVILAWRQNALLSSQATPWITAGFTEPENAANGSFFVTNNNSEEAAIEYTLTQKNTPTVSETLTLEAGQTRTISPQGLEPHTNFTVSITNPYHDPLSLFRKY